MTAFIAIPAIDVRDGRVVRLRQGDYAQETRYADTPFERAMGYADAGAKWLHLVDLDAARVGGFTLHGLLARIANDARLSVQCGGGVRNADDVQAILDAGAARVVVGSLAVEQPSEVASWLERFGSERIVIAFDVRNDSGQWRPATRGWTREGSATLYALLAHYSQSGLRHVLCTDIARDGMLNGPNFDLYRTMCAAAPGIAFQASGGVRDHADLDGLRATGCTGAVLGRSLLEGTLALEAALAC